MKTKQVMHSLFHFLKWRQNYVVDELTDMSCALRFQTDMLQVTKAGYAHGIEVKVSKADLKNDLKKKHIRAANKPIVTSHGKKLDHKFYFGCFKYFSYAVPEDLVDAATKQIPDFCGLIVIKKNTPPHLACEYIRKPQKLYNYKWSQKEIFNLLRLGTMRIINNYK